MTLSYSCQGDQQRACFLCKDFVLSSPFKLFQASFSDALLLLFLSSFVKEYRKFSKILAFSVFLQEESVFS